MVVVPLLLVTMKLWTKFNYHRPLPVPLPMAPLIMPPLIDLSMLMAFPEPLANQH
jgi:hypothetical protein